jgi:hypothetical protein
MKNTYISNDFFDNNTYQLLFNRINEEDINYINNIEYDMRTFIFNRWRTIINSFMPNYYNEYSSVPIESRNIWFQKYLDLPTHDINEMPESLL